VSGGLWRPPRPLPAGVSWSPRSHTVSYAAGGRRLRLPAPVLEAETAVWRDLDGRPRFGVHQAGVLDLYAAAAGRLRTADPYLHSRAASWQHAALASCWHTAIALFERGEVIQACLDALDLEPSPPAASGPGGRRAAGAGVWAVVATAVRLADVEERG
jgi:hypothetical protein